MTSLAFIIRNRVATRFDLHPMSLSQNGGQRYRGNHGTKALADARAATCWALHEHLKLNQRAIGRLVGLAPSSVRQAILRAPKRFKRSELEGFAGGEA